MFFKRSLKTFVTILITIYGFLSMLVAPTIAQSTTALPQITKPLPLNQTLAAQLRDKGDSLTYSVTVPQDQDVIFTIRSTRYVAVNSCFFIDGVETAVITDCPLQGGGGGDSPMYRIEYLATHGKMGQQATVTLSRPLDGSASLQITAFAVTRQSVTLGDNLRVSKSIENRFHVYTLETDFLVPFTATIEAEATDGNFLWAFYNPFSFGPRVSEAQRMKPAFIDGAIDGNQPITLHQLHLYHLGGNTFHIVVEANQDFILSTSVAGITALAEGQTQAVTLSYRHPVHLFAVNAKAGEVIKINFAVISGIGAIARTYQAGLEVNQGLFLGAENRADTPFPLTGEFEVFVDPELHAEVQIPFDFTRETVQLEIRWQRMN